MDAHVRNAILAGVRPNDPVCTPAHGTRLEYCQLMAGLMAGCVILNSVNVTRLRQVMNLDLVRVVALLLTRPVEPLERLAGGEEQVLLSGLTRLIVGRGACVRACRTEPGAH